MRSFLIRVAAFLMSMFLISEIFFRLGLPARQYPASVMDDSTRIRYYQGPSEGLFTYGALCSGRYRWRINTQGWNSPYDYTDRVHRNNQMVALIGDSYIEGYWADLDDHLEVQLHEECRGRIDFYSFGTWGAMLSQYLVISRHVIDSYQPDVLVVFLNDEDVSGSTDTEHAPVHLCHTVETLPDEGFHMVPPPMFRINPVIPLLLKSATLRYLKTNRNLAFLARGGVADRNANLSEEDTDLQEFEPIDSISIAATEYLLTQFDSLGVPVIFVLDGPRAPVYRGESDPVGYPDCILVKNLCQSKQNLICIDLIPYFVSDWATNGILFSSEDNPHWNGYGNSVVADAILPEVLNAL